MAPIVFKAVCLLLTLVTLPQVLAVPTTPGDIERETLAIHNIIRVFNGAENLEWNEDLAAVAQFRSVLCNSGKKIGDYGENLANGTDFTVTKAVTSWQTAAKGFNRKNPVYSPYTQVIWKGTKQVGCAVAACPAGTFDPNQVIQFVVCEYRPAGNIPGQASQNL